MTEDLSAVLRMALGAVRHGIPDSELRTATEQLISRYRSPKPAPSGSPIISDAALAVAYATYRMPATYAVCRRVLAEIAESVAPSSVVDLGGGTGAAAWAAVSAWAGVREVTVVDSSDAALRLGRELAATSGESDVSAIEFVPADLTEEPSGASADLAVVSYVLSELAEGDQRRVVETAKRLAPVVAVIEPGTSDGYRRVLSVRDQLLSAGWQLLGPCPHAGACPLAEHPGEWCHAAVRVSRSADHRRAKAAALSYEDEKYSWVAAIAPTGIPTHLTPPTARVLRHPLVRKGFVEFQVCRPDGTAGRDVVSKKQGERYRAARDLKWGDRLPP